MNDDRFLGRRHAAVAADRGSGIEARRRVIEARGADRRGAELLKRVPIPDEHVVVHHRHFRRVQKRGFLRLGQLGDEAGNQAVVAGEDDVARRNGVRLPAAHVDDRKRPVPNPSPTRPPYPDRRAAQTDSG